MASELVTSEVNKGVIWLTIKYDEEFLLKKELTEKLQNVIVDSYREKLGKNEKELTTKSCVVEIQSKTAGSRLVRALFELWKEVDSNLNSQLICVGYPDDYIDSLISLGLTSLPNFKLKASKEEALKQLEIT